MASKWDKYKVAEAPDNKWDKYKIQAGTPSPQIQQSGQSGAYPIRNVARNIGQTFAEGAEKITDTLTNVDPNETLGQTFKRAPRRALRVTGDVIGTGWGITGDIINPAITEAAKHADVDRLKAVTPDMIEQGMVKSAMYAGEKVNEFTQKYPEASRDIEAAGNIASVLPVNRAIKAGYEAVKKPVQAGKNIIAPSLLRRANKTADVLNADVKRRVSAEALDIVKLKPSSLTTKETEAALGNRTMVNKSFGRKEMVTMPQDIAIGKNIEELVQKRIVKKNARPSDNIKGIYNDIEELGRRTEIIPGMESKVYDKDTLLVNLQKARTDSQVIFTGEATVDKAYDNIADEFFRILKDQPDTVQGLLLARKKFDQKMKRMFGEKLFNKDPANNLRHHAIRNTGTSVNDAVEAILPDGNPYKELLKKQALHYKAIDRIKHNAIRKPSFQTLKHLGRHVGVHAALVGGGGVLGSILGSPILLSGLVLSGSVYVGGRIVTSKQLRTVLSNFLRNPGIKTTAIQQREIAEVVRDLSKIGPPLIKREPGVYKSAKPQSVESILKNM